MEYLKELRNKFLDQGYPISMINCEFRRALEVDRKDLIFSTNKQKKRTVIAPLIVTFSPGNPNFRKWISEEISTLHEEPKLRTKLVVYLSWTEEWRNVRCREVPVLWSVVECC